MIQLGDTKNVVAVIHCDLDTLKFLATELPQGDGFTRDLWRAVSQAEADLEAHENGPGLSIGLVYRRLL